MSKEYKISLSLEGLPKDNGDASFDVFLKHLSHINSIIKRMDKELSTGSRTIEIKVSRINRSSPYGVELEVHPKVNQLDNRGMVLGAISRSLIDLEEGRIPSIHPDIVRDYQKLSKDLIGERLLFSTIKIMGREHDFSSSSFIETTKKALSSVDECFSSYEGVLEQINLHNEANIFYIYPPTGADKIRCHFPPDLCDIAIEGIGRKIEARGLAKYSPLADYPYEMDVRDIDIYPVEEELPTLEELRGIIVASEKKKASEEIIAEMRDEWF